MTDDSNSPLTADTIPKLVRSLFEDRSAHQESAQSRTADTKVKTKTKCLETLLGFQETTIYNLRNGGGGNQAKEDILQTLKVKYPNARTFSEFKSLLGLEIAQMMKDTPKQILPGLYYGYYRRLADPRQIRKVARFVLTLSVRNNTSSKKSKPEQIAHLLSPSTFKTGKWQFMHGDLYVYLQHIRCKAKIPYNEMIIIPGVETKIQSHKSINKLLGASLWSDEDIDPTCSKFRLEKQTVPHDLFDKMDITKVADYPFNQPPEKAIGTFFERNQTHSREDKQKIVDFLLTGEIPEYIEEFYSAHPDTNLTVTINQH